MFEVVLREDNSAPVQLAIGQAYLAANDFTSASEAFERARKLDPHLPGLHFAIGASFWKQQRAADAIAAWREELKTEPGSFETNFALGAALVERSRFGEGERRLSAARSLRPDHAPTLYYLGRIAWKRRGPEALTLVRRSVELDGSNRAARYLLAQIYTARGWKQAAAREFAAVRALSNRQVDEDVDILSSARK